MSHRLRRRWNAVAVLASLGAVTACGSATGGATSVVTVDIGYQSKTINTVNAGTLLRDLGYFDRRLAQIGRPKGVTYRVVWHDFASGPPLTAQMIAGKVAIGSMGDYPLLVNGDKSQAFADARSEFVGVTGYNLRGSLNQVVVPSSSSARTIADLRGKVISTSVGSAAHGMLVRALSDAGLKTADVQILGQDPPIGVSAVESGRAAALAQFVPFPQKMIFEGKARLLYDGGSTGIPTFHGIVARRKWAEQHPEVLQAFLATVRQTTDYMHAHPLDAAERVAKATGLAPEVVYLYNGPGGLVTFDPTIKPPLVAALRKDLPFLKELGAVRSLDVGAFTDDGTLRQVYGAGYDAARASLTNPSRITGHDPVCGEDITDPTTASEAWFGDGVQPAATPTCLLRAVKKKGTAPRALYTPAADTGERIFGESAAWVHDPKAKKDGNLLPFATAAAAAAYAGAHSGATTLGYKAALAAA